MVLKHFNKHCFTLLAVFLFGAVLTSVTAAADLEKYYVKKDLGGYEIIVEDKWGDDYLVEYGIGCLSMWRYEGKYIYIDKGLFLDGIGDTIYLFDSDDECRVWDADEIDNSASSDTSFASYFATCVSLGFPQAFPYCYSENDYENLVATKQSHSDPQVVLCRSQIDAYEQNYKKCYDLTFGSNLIPTTAPTLVVTSYNHGCPSWLVYEGGECVKECANGYKRIGKEECVSYNQWCFLEYGDYAVYEGVGRGSYLEDSKCQCRYDKAWDVRKRRCVDPMDLVPTPAPTQTFIPTPIPTKVPAQTPMPIFEQPTRRPNPTNLSPQYSADFPIDGVEKTVQTDDGVTEEIILDDEVNTMSGQNLRSPTSNEEAPTFETPGDSLFSKIMYFLKKLKFW